MDDSKVNTGGSSATERKPQHAQPTKHDAVHTMPKHSHDESLTNHAERHLKLRIDVRLLPLSFALYVFCFLDRASMGNARLAGMEKSLSMRGLDFNVLLSVFYIAYIFFALPSTMLCKVVGPKIWLPAITVGFGLFTFVMAFTHTFAAACVTRFLLGVAEAGHFPSIAFYLSRWYRRDELAFRLSAYIIAAPTAGAFGGLLASGILRIDHIGWLRTWRQIFFIEGLLTIFVGAVALFLLADGPQTAKWLSQEEKDLAARRLAEDVKGTRTRSVLGDKKVNHRQLKRGIFSVTTMALAFAFFFLNIIVQGLAFFLPTVIRTLYPNRTVVQLQLLTVPPYIAGGVFVLALPYLSMKTRHRTSFVILGGLLIAIGFAINTGTHAASSHARYAASFLICMGSFPLGALVPGWAANNQTDDTSRAAAIGTVVSAGNLGGLVACWTYLLRDAPDYTPGNALNLAGGCSVVLSTATLAAYLWWENGKRDKGERDEVVTGLTVEEEEELGHLHPAFRYCL